jgi:hypothetical protein
VNEATMPRIERNRIGISPYSDTYLHKDDKLIIMFNPNNIIVSGNTSIDILDEVQALSFHGALRNIPVVIINPNLIATAWNDYGARTPLLLSDFVQAYFICDDYAMLSKEKFCGVIKRASAGTDLFILNGFRQGSFYPQNYTRIESWPHGIPDSITTSLSKLLAKDTSFTNAILKNIESNAKQGLHDRY